MAYSCILPRKEKRIIYHRYSLTFFFLDYLCGYPAPQIQGQFHPLCLVICGLTSSVKQEILPMSELPRKARKYSNFSAVFINQPSLLMMKYGMENKIQQIQRKESFSRYLSLTKLHDFSLSTGVERNFMHFFFPSATVVI